MRVLMIAPPGAGKGTQGALIAAHFGIPHIATGELLRDHVARRTPLGQAVQAYLDRGDSCPTRLSWTWCGRSWPPRRRPAVVRPRRIPRTMQQARATYLIGRELEMTAAVAGLRDRLQPDSTKLLQFVGLTNKQASHVPRCPPQPASGLTRRARQPRR